MKRNYLSSCVAILVLAVFLFPLYWMLNTSLQSKGLTAGLDLIPIHPTLNGYASAIREQGHSLVISIVVAIGATILSLLIATPAAYALAKVHKRSTNWFIFFILLSQMVPGIIIANALYGAYNNLNLLDSILGLILADSAAGIPFSILIIRAFMRQVSGSIIEAAKVDGASEFRIFTSIVVPVARNSIITAGLFSFLFAWGDFLFALTLTTNENARPITLGIYTYIGTQVQDWGAVMATAVLASIPAALLLILAQKYMAAGISAGSVK